MSTFTEIAEEILASAKTLDGYVGSNTGSRISVENDALADLPATFEANRKSLINSAQLIKRLALGATGQLLESLFTFTDILSIRFLYRYNIPKHVPSSGMISYVDLAAACGADETLVRRFLQHAMISQFFTEPRPGFVSHSAVSHLLKRDPKAMDTIGFLVEDLMPASTKVMEAFKRWPGSGEPNETGFNIENKTSDPFYIEIGKDEERSRRFGAGMRFMTAGSLYDINHLIRGYQWADFDRPGSLLVDIGGGHGSVSRALANATSHLKFVVQDLPGTVEEGRKILPHDLSGRITFQAHDFMTPQPTINADIYFFRFILHNWSDQYAVKILENLLCALRDGSRIIIYEFLPSENADYRWTEKQSRNLDMIQTTCWNSLERRESGWKSLFAKVDSRLHFLGTRTREGSSISLIEAVYRTE